MSSTSRDSGFTQYERDLRSCVRDLVALSTMPTWWIGRSTEAIAESAHDLLLSMLRTDTASVQVWDPKTEQLLQVPNPAPAVVSLQMASSPIGVEGELGRLSAGSSRPDFPTKIEALLLQVAANQVAVALRHTALLVRHQAGEQLLAARAAQQAAVARIGLRALGGIPTTLILDEAVETVCDTLHVELCEVLELAPDGESLILRAGAGWRPGVVGRARVSAGRESHAGYTMAVADAVIVDDLRRETRFTVPALLGEHGAVSGMSVIIHDHDRPFGVLGALSRELRHFSPDDTHFLQSIANLLAATLQRHQVEAQREDLLLQLQRAVTARDRAVGIVSHDLGNPLSTIQICATAMLDPDPPPAEGIRRMAEIIHRSAAWMQQIVHDLLDRASIDAGRLVLDRRPTALGPIVEAAQTLFIPVAAEHGVNFSVEVEPGLPPVNADPNRLQQVLSNLLGNAMKFTPANGRVTLSISEDATDPGLLGPPAPAAVRFEVRDTGPGIPPEDLGHVFDWFWHSQRPGQSGTGLGLAIAKGLIEAHGSHLRVESTPGRGTTFWFSMPEARQAEAGGSPSAHPSREA